MGIWQDWGPICRSEPKLNSALSLVFLFCVLRGCLCSLKLKDLGSCLVFFHQLTEEQRGGCGAHCRHRPLCGDSGTHEVQAASMHASSPEVKLWLWLVMPEKAVLACVLARWTHPSLLVQHSESSTAILFFLITSVHIRWLYIESLQWNRIFLYKIGRNSASD